MKGFVKKSTYNPEDEWDSRQKLITGWDSEAIKESTVLVIGAGAIGNETVKNLALLGFGNVIICDLDNIENSNLTRTVLFSKQDLGKRKAPTAAEKIKEMNLEQTSCADSFDGDIVYELGDGVFRRATVVLGCLDNVETRMYVNKVCMQYDIPYVDAGIGSLACNIQIMKGHSYGCYACYAADYKFEDRFRMSCDITKKKAAETGKMATVQTASAIVSGLQVQEALKIVCGMNPGYGTELHFQGTANMFNKFSMPVDEACVCHAMDERKYVYETELSVTNTLKELLELAESKGYSVLSFEDESLKDMRNFIAYTQCPNCGTQVRIFRPFHKVFFEDCYCEACKKNPHRSENFYNDLYEIALGEFSLETTENEVLNLTLEELGIPKFHVLKIWDADKTKCAYFELTRDFANVLPEYYKKHFVK